MESWTTGHPFDLEELAENKKDHTEAKVTLSSTGRSDVMFFNQRIGSIKRLFPNDDPRKFQDSCISCCWLPTSNNYSTNTPTINGPMPIYVRSWMNEYYHRYSLLLFASSHTASGDEEVDLKVMGLELNKETWKCLHSFSLRRKEHLRCNSLHSPSIAVDEEQQRLYMYIHGHGCHGAKQQPTLLFTSHDGLSWDFDQAKLRRPPYLLWDLFYLSAPRYSPRDDFYYAIAKTQEDSIGSAVLCRSKSLHGPFEQGPILMKGGRHMDMYIHPGSSDMYVFFTLIGDAPERILLGMIDRSPASGGSHNWLDWKFLPGPIIIQPEYEFEHGNAPLKPSKPGPGLTVLNEIRDPHFLPHNDTDLKKLSGFLFYTVQGEQKLAMSTLQINITALHAPPISYRSHSMIRNDVLPSTSLVDADVSQARDNKKVLITGVGRSGTTSLCSLFQLLYLNVSHDNDIDCGPYPGPDGAVSWYDAFKSSRKYSHILHLVRNPLKTINSRALRCSNMEKFLRRVVNGYEDVSDLMSHNTSLDSCLKFALKHWVRRNSFVENYASWREQMEHLQEPLTVWNLCMAGHFGPRCKSLTEIGAKIKKVPTDLNSSYSNTTLSLFQKQTQIKKTVMNAPKQTWKELAEIVQPVNEKYIKIAKEMSRRYGYDVVSDGVGPIEYECKFTEQNGSNLKKWDCFISGSL